jgi:hypothetical protein
MGKRILPKYLPFKREKASHFREAFYLISDYFEFYF